MTITESLVSFARDTSLEEIPEPVRSWGVDLLLDTVASALAGVRGDETAMIRALSAEVGGSGEYSVIGGGTSSAIGATLVNGYQVTAVTACDVHKPLLFHVTPEVVAPALALAEGRKLSGADLLAATIIGCEVAIRVGLGLHYPTFRAKGWHSPGVSGPLGGAAAAARLLGLDATQHRNALGLAGSQSAGTFAAWGTPQIKWHQSRGAASGLLAALLAAEGFGASEDILTHPDGGLLNVYSDGGRPEAVTHGLGITWEMEELTLRRWPVASALQGLVSVCRSLYRDGVRVDEIREIRVGLSQQSYSMYQDLGWKSKFQSHLSPRYIASIVLHDGQCWLDQFEEQRRLDPSVSDIANAVVLEVDEGLHLDGATVMLVMSDGVTRRARIDVPPGDPANRLPRDELISKFHEAREDLIDDVAAAELLDMLVNIEQVRNVADVARLMRARVAP